jgi:hypothetical protein
MFKYNSKYAIMGMCGKYQILGDFQGLRKNKNKAVSFDANFTPDFPNIFYSYIYDKPTTKPVTKNTQVISKLDSDFFELSGKDFREIRETRNKFDKIVTSKEYNKEHVLELIDRWDAQSGDRYGWFKHSGYDREFFRRWYDEEKDNLISKFYYINDKIVGYAILHKENGCYTYMLRKADNTIRNTCLYVDYKTFESIYGTENSTIFVNWGASKGTLLRYKRKFPVFEENNVYFYKKATK